MLERAPVGHLGLVDDRDRARVLPVKFALAESALHTAVDHKPKRSAEPARVRARPARRARPAGPRAEAKPAHVPIRFALLKKS